MQRLHTAGVPSINGIESASPYGPSVPLWVWQTAHRLVPASSAPAPTETRSPSHPTPSSPPRPC